MGLTRIRYRMLAVLGLALAAGLAATAAFYLRHAEQAILAEHTRTLHKLTESVISGIESMMHSGRADIAREYVARLQTGAGLRSFEMLRADGSAAFVDDRTVRAVNERLGRSAFAARAPAAPVQVMAPGDARLAQARSGVEAVLWYETDAAGERVAHMLDPVFAQPACGGCHDPAERVRGIVKVSVSLAAAERDILANRITALVALGAALLVTLLITGYALGRAVLRPLERVNEAMQRVAGGDLAREVPQRGRDELARMAASFNRMVGRLRRTYGQLRAERDKLTTIILVAREAIVVTDADDRVVLVNPAAQRLLGKSAERIIAEGLARLLDDAPTMQRLLEQGCAGSSEIAPYGGRVLQVCASRIRDAYGRPIGCAALLRDVTEEKRLEEELRRLATTDALTALTNRRHADERLRLEVERAARSGQALAVLMLDIDHFKRFNDDHGHDQGDRVLRGVAEVFAGGMRRYDLAARYGGEEFMAILPGADRSEAQAVAERLRARVASLRVDGLAVTVSIGVATSEGAVQPSAEALLRGADGALYAAKAAGRNAVRCAPGTEAVAA